MGARRSGRPRRGKRARQQPELLSVIGEQVFLEGVEVQQQALDEARTQPRPWRRDRHQINHAVHHRVPPDVEAKTKQTSYLAFPRGTRFRIVRFEGGTAADPNPRVVLDPTNPTGWKRTQSQAPPSWRG
jgi:hypothetical protein